MTTIATPNNIEVLLWCHCRVGLHERIEAPAVHDTLMEFLQMGAIEREVGEPEHHFTTTPLGRAWVQALCNVPPPKSVFVDESGRALV